MNTPRPQPQPHLRGVPPVTTDQLYRSRDRVKLVCGFYGPEHPECKKAVNHDTELYLNFMKQFQTRDDDDDDARSTEK